MIHGVGVPNQAAEAGAAFGGIMMSSFEPRRSLAAIRYAATKFIDTSY